MNKSNTYGENELDVYLCAQNQPPQSCGNIAKSMEGQWFLCLRLDCCQILDSTD